MFRTDDMYGDYPTLEEIRRDYNELVEMVGNVVTIEQAKEWNQKDKFTIEINGENLEEFINNDGTDTDIKHIRYEAYGCLAYIYFYIKNGVVDDIVFDVWSNKCDADFIQDSSIGNIEANYEMYVSFSENA